MVLFFPLWQLLVNSKIISLDLPVKDVYKKIWCPEGEVCGPYLKCLYYAFVFRFFFEEKEREYTRNSYLLNVYFTG